MIILDKQWIRGFTEAQQQLLKAEFKQNIKSYGQYLDDISEYDLGYGRSGKHPDKYGDTIKEHTEKDIKSKPGKNLRQRIKASQYR